MQRRILLATAGLMFTGALASNALACKMPDFARYRAPLAVGAQNVTRLPDQPPASTQPEDQENRNSIAGLWYMTVTSNGQVVDRGWDAWHADGTETLTDDTPPLLSNVCIGVWTQTGPSTYKLKHPSFIFDNNGNVTGTAIIRQNVTLDAKGNTYSGEFTVQVLDTNGKQIDSFSGKVSATRVTPD